MNKKILATIALVAFVLLAGIPSACAGIIGEDVKFLNIDLWIWLAIIAFFMIVFLWVPQVSRAIPKQLYAILLLVVLVLAVLASPLVVKTTTPPAETATTEEYTLDVTGSAVSSWVSYDSVAKKFTVPFYYNSTSGSILQTDNSTALSYAVLNFTVVAMPTAVSDVNKVVPVTATASAPSFSSGGTTYYVVTKASDNKYNLLWTTQDGTSERETISFTVQYSTPKYVNLNITFDATGLGQISLFSSKTINVVVGGETFTVEVQKVHEW